MSKRPSSYYLTPPTYKRVRELGSAVVSGVTGIPEPIVGAAARVLFPDIQEDLKMSGPSLNGARSTRCTVKGKKYKKSAKIARMINQLSALHEYRAVQNSRFVSLVGRQRYFILGYDSVGTNPITGVGGTGTLTSLDLEWVRNQVAGAAPALGTMGYRFVIKVVKDTHSITNSTTGNCDVIIYDFTPRDNIYAIADSNLYPADLAFFTGLTSTWQTSNIALGPTLQFSTDDPATYPGATPFDSGLFCSHYKIIRTHKQCLAPGQCFTHTVTAIPNKIWDDTSFFDESVSNVAGSNIAYLAKKTILSMMIIKGPTTHDSGGAHPSGIAASAVDIVTNRLIKYSYGPAPHRQINTYIDVLTAPTTAMQAVDLATNAFVNVATL